MAVVVGLTAVISLRVLGFPAAVPLGAYRGLIPYLIGAFLVNAASGAALFVSDAVALSTNPSFIVKMVSIVAGVVVLWRMNATVLARAGEADDAFAASVDADGSAPAGAAAASFVISGSAKTLAIAAVLIWWLSVLVSGRLVAYLSAAV